MEAIKETLAAGRKFKLAIICLVILLAGFGIAGIAPAFAALYSELITAVLGTLFIYSGGNVAGKWAIGKKESLTLKGEDTTLEGGTKDGDVNN